MTQKRQIRLSKRQSRQPFVAHDMSAVPKVMLIENLFTHFTSTSVIFDDLPDQYMCPRMRIRVQEGQTQNTDTRFRFEFGQLHVFLFFTAVALPPF